MAMISSAIAAISRGGCANRWIGVQSTEILFRDTAHGFWPGHWLPWSAQSFWPSPATSLIGGATSGAVQASASQDGSDGYLRRYSVAAEQPYCRQHANANSGELRRELVRFVYRRLPEWWRPSAADRSYIAKVVAARTGLSQADADKRVNDVIVQVKADLDKARKAAMKLAIWLTLSLFIGAFSAALAATEGGGLRDGTWRQDSTRSLTLINQTERRLSCRFFCGCLEYRSR